MELAQSTYLTIRLYLLKAPAKLKREQMKADLRESQHLVSHKAALWYALRFVADLNTFAHIGDGVHVVL